MKNRIIVLIFMNSVCSLFGCVVVLWHNEDVNVVNPGLVYLCMLYKCIGIYKKHFKRIVIVQQHNLCMLYITSSMEIVQHFSDTMITYSKAAHTNFCIEWKCENDRLCMNVWKKKYVGIYVHTLQYTTSDVVPQS